MDNRRHPRTLCFQISHDHDLTPVWVFRRATAEGILGLVVDFSESGLQALVEKDEALEAECFTLFIDGLTGTPGSEPWFPVTRKWAGDHLGLYDRCGFAFSDPAVAQACVRFMNAEVLAGKGWIRCELLAGPTHG